MAAVLVVEWAERLVVLTDSKAETLVERMDHWDSELVGTKAMSMAVQLAPLMVL